MAKSRLLGRKKRQPVPVDEFGGRADGGLAIVGTNEKIIHTTSPVVAASLRYFLARVELNDALGLPERTAMTSAIRGEGVTFLARSLASVLAYDSATSVAVVDMSWQSPRRAEPAPPGLAEVVEQRADLDDIIITTTNPRLALVPAGAMEFARRPAVAISSRLGDVVADIGKRYDYLLLDLPPVLATSEAISLAELADGYVLVIRQGVTSTSQVEAAINELRGSDSLGVVLNQYSSKIPKRLQQLVAT